MLSKYTLKTLGKILWVKLKLANIFNQLLGKGESVG